MEVNKKITKIVVNRDDELTDIVSGGAEIGRASCRERV